MPTMDWDSLYRDAADAGKPPPLGVEIDAICEDFKWGHSKAGDPQAKMRFRITSKDGKGKTFFDNLTFIPGQPEFALARNLDALARVGLTKEKLKTLTEDQQAMTAIGAEVRVVLRQADGSDWINVERYAGTVSPAGRAGGPPPRS